MNFQIQSKNIAKGNFWIEETINIIETEILFKISKVVMCKVD